MEDDSYAEQIADRLIFCFEILEIDHFRGDIARRSAANEHVVLIGLLGEAEVSDDAVEVSLLPQQDVFRFEIAVHDVVCVHDFEPLKNAFHDHFDLLGGELVL